MYSGRERIPETKASCKNTMKETLVENKNDTKRIRIEKENGIDITELVVVDETDEEIEDDDSKDSDFYRIDNPFSSVLNDDDDRIFNSDTINSNVERSMKSLRAKVKKKKSCLIKRGKVASPGKRNKWFL
ncbi:hypothetical protein FXO37_33215 [Capsicum annuum]|nr:hypothetical protein FXO37_33215 [Capsicum annuum]